MSRKCKKYSISEISIKKLIDTKGFVLYIINVISIEKLILEVMNVEKYIFDLFNMFRGHKSPEQFVKEAKVLTFLAYKNSIGEIDLDNIDLSNHNEFNNRLLAISDICKDVNTKNLLKDIVTTGIIYNSEELNNIYEYLLNFESKSLLEFMNCLYDNLGLYLGKNSYVDMTEYELSKLIYSISLRENPNSILDICSGQGIFLSQYKHNENLEVIGFEINPYSVLLSKLRLDMNEQNYCINEINVLNTPMEATADFVFSEYPWGIRLGDNVVADINNVVSYDIGKYRADWAFINKAINATNENGVTVVVSPNGVLYSAPDEKIRQQVVENGLLSCVISMPANTLLNTSIPYTILIFKKNSKCIKFIDCQNEYINILKTKRAINVNRILELYDTTEENEFVKFVTQEEIKRNNWNLNFGLYFVESEIAEFENAKSLKEVASIIPGIQYTSKNVTELNPGQGEYDVVRITNLINEEIELDNLVSIDGEADKLERYLLKENDILIATKGTVLKMCLVTGLKNPKTIFNGNLTVVRANSNEVSAVYLYNYLNSETGRAMLMMKRTGSVIMNISRNALQELQVPIVDRDIQEIVENRYFRIMGELSNLKKQQEMLKKKLANIFEEEVEL